MNKEITRDDLIEWIDRPPSNDDLNMCKYIIGLQEENEKLKKQITEYQDEIFARDNSWYDMQS